MGGARGRAGDGRPASAGGTGASPDPAERRRPGQDQGHQRSLRAEPQAARATHSGKALTQCFSVSES